jgi:hypothetical protein
MKVLDRRCGPLTNRVYIDTFNDCNKNLVLLRFKRNR